MRVGLVRLALLSVMVGVCLAGAEVEEEAEAPELSRYSVVNSGMVQWAFSVLLATLACIQFGIGSGEDKNAGRVINGVHRGWD